MIGKPSGHIYTECEKYINDNVDIIYYSIHCVKNGFYNFFEKYILLLFIDFFFLNLDYNHRDFSSYE